MENTNAYFHLTLEERRIILKGITNGSTKTAIAQTIGKDKSTVGKEIRTHRVLVKKCPLPLECSAYRKCPFDRQCSPGCPDYVPFRCSRRDRSPGACNGCPGRSRCRFDKYDYNPEKAQASYRETLVDSRAGINLTSSEAKAMADIIGPLLRQGLSPYQILQAHPELGVCEKTIYNYIESDVFHEVAGITVMDLRRQVSGKLPKARAVTYRKRQDRRYLQGRTYRDYNAYLSQNPGVFVTQMDTVYNDESHGPFIQTFKFVKAGLLFAFLQEEKTAPAMLHGVSRLEEILAPGSSAGTSTSCSLTGEVNSAPPRQWRLPQTAPAAQGCSFVTPCSPGRKARWRTNTLSCAISSQSRRTCGASGWLTRTPSTLC